MSMTTGRALRGFQGPGTGGRAGRGAAGARRLAFAALVSGASVLPAAAAQPAPASAAPVSAASGAQDGRLWAFRSLALSPDGERAASVDAEVSPADVKPAHGRIVVRDRDGRRLETLDPCETCRYGALAFSPDGRRLAFLAFGDGGEVTLRVAEGGASRVLASYKGAGQAVSWSPDGSRIALLATVGAHKDPGATQPGRPLVGEIGEAPDEQRIAIVPASGGPVAFATPSDTYVYEYAWAPSGDGFVGVAAKGDGDDNWWVAGLERFGLDGAPGRRLPTPDAQISNPVISPDGRQVAFVAGLMSDFGSFGGDVFVEPVEGGAPRDVTPGLKGSASALAWTASGLKAEALMGADETVLSIDPSGSAPPRPERLPLWPTGGHVQFSRNGQVVAMVASSFTRAPEILLGPASDLRALTRENAAAPARVSARSLAWTSDGFDIQGWLVGPPGAPAPGRRPLLVEVHGGPGAAVRPGYIGPGELLDLVDHGYYVLMPNPRGSFGQGEAFTRANVKDFGGGDLKDILAGVDEAVRSAPVDGERVGVFGHSYGGFMTMWAVTHTDRFKAAVAGAGIADWMSYYGENGIDKWMIPFFGASAYDDPATYDRLSPIRYIKAAKTPTFIYVGERDVECPPSQSLEFWHGLVAVGVPTSLVIYPGEGHGIRKPEDQHDIARRTLAWFDRYLKPQSSAAASRPETSAPASLGRGR